MHTYIAVLGKRINILKSLKSDNRHGSAFSVPQFFWYFSLSNGLDGFVCP